MFTSDQVRQGFSHRLVVAIPLVLAVVALTLREGLVRDAGALLERRDEVRVQGGPGAEYDVSDGRIDVAAGAVLVHAPAYAEIVSGDWTVAVWGGGAYVSVHSRGLTVAAFDVPLVARGPYGTAVIPPARQWRTPATFLPDPEADPVAWAASLDLEPLPRHFLDEHAPTLRSWRTAVPAAADRTAEELGAAETPALAGMALADPRSRLVAAAVRSRAVLRLYGLLHPVLRDASWGYVREDARPDGDTWMGLMALPVLERSDVSASPLTVRKWGETLAVAIDASADPDALRSALVPVFAREVARMAEEGYPIRALRFAEAVRHAVGTGAVLTPEAVTAYERLRTMTPESLRASVLSEIAAPVPVIVPTAADERVIDADPVLEQLARERLTVHGGMFTPESSIRTVGPGTVDVRDVVFGLSSGDRLLRFDYVVRDDAVRARVDGEVLPYAVPFDAYLAWEASR